MAKSPFAPTDVWVARTTDEDVPAIVVSPEDAPSTIAACWEEGALLAVDLWRWTGHEWERQVSWGTPDE